MIKERLDTLVKDSNEILFTPNLLANSLTIERNPPQVAQLSSR